jgi:hypothetical protein
MSTPAAPVLWTVKARRQLRRQLVAGRAGDAPHAPGEEKTWMERILRLLSRTFPGCPVVVQDQMLSFTPRRDLYVLLVEVCQGGHCPPGAYVVKVGPRALLQREIDGWEVCRPEGLRHDLVLLPLEPGQVEEAPPDGAPLMSLVYGDAHQFIGVESTLSLEAAALHAVRFGVPTVESVCEVLVQLYERIGHLLHSASAEDNPARDDFVLDVPRLADRLPLWGFAPDGRSGEDARPYLQSVLTDIECWVRRGVGQYLSAPAYMRYVLQHVRHRRRRGRRGGGGGGRRRAGGAAAGGPGAGDAARPRPRRPARP